MSVPRLLLLRPVFRSPLRTPFRPPLRPFSRPISSTRPRLAAAATGPPAPTAKPTLSSRLKSLSKEYGYSALGVYLGLSALDFPFCFLAVRTIGSDRIGEYEDVAVNAVRGWYNAAAPVVGLPAWGVRATVEGGEVAGEEGKASIWTELALAYAIHKSLIFLRVPLTAAVTPKVVKKLRGWGWDIGRKGGVRSAVEKGKSAVERAGKNMKERTGRGMD